jgi:hypothetical protein
MRERPAPVLTPKLVARFWSKVDIRGPDDCWLYLADRKQRSPEMRVGPRKYIAPQIALWLAGKPRPAGMGALHSCDNSRCCNPAHLRWGTQAENIADKVERDRCAKAFGKLSPADVAEILASGATHADLAREFGVSHGSIVHIRKRAAVRHVLDWVLDQADVPAEIVASARRALGLHGGANGREAGAVRAGDGS